MLVPELSLCATFKVLRRARTRCSLSLSRGSLALWVKQRLSSCLLQGLGSPRAVTLACSRARYSCSSPSNGSGSRPSDTRRSLPSDTLLSLLSTLNSRRSETARRKPVRLRFTMHCGVFNTNKPNQTWWHCVLQKYQQIKAFQYSLRMCKSSHTGLHTKTFFLMAMEI